MNKLMMIAAAAAIALVVPAASSPAVAKPDVTQTATPVTQMAHISIESIGKGPPVLFIPGLSMPRESWRVQADQLKANHRVLLVQINGFGGSEPGDNLKPDMLAGVVADLHSYAAKEDIKPLVVGHSLGGTLALEWAKAYPDDIARALIVDALPWVGLIMAPPSATPDMLEPQAAAMRDQMAARHGKPADIAITRATMARLALKPASQEQAAQWSMGADPRVTAAAFYEDLMLDLRKDVGAIKVPITLLYPWSDKGVPKAMADQMYRGAYAEMPNMTFVPVSDSAHFIMLDQPEQFQKALAAFLVEKAH